jgi:hypothetical protein
MMVTTRPVIADGQPPWCKHTTTEGFGGIDMSGYPDFNKLPPEEEAQPHDKHGFNNVDFGPSIKGIQDFCNNPPVDVLERIAAETNNPELANQIATQRTGDIAMQFVNSTPEYVASDENFEAIVKRLCFANNQTVLTRLDTNQAAVELYILGYWTVENLQAAFNELVQDSALEMPEGTLRNLSPQQLNECELLAVTNRLPDAIATYIKYRIGEDICDAMSQQEQKDVLTSPAYRDLLFETAVWAFTQVEPSVVINDEMMEFAKPYLKGRYPSVPLLKAVYAEYLKQVEDERRYGVISPSTPVTQENLDDLSDAQINDLKSRTLREFSRQVKNPKRGAIIK